LEKNLSDFSNVEELSKYYKDDVKCRKYLEKILWNEKPVCPHCGHEKIYTFSNGMRYKCAACRKDFTITIGTFLEGSKIPLYKWFKAIFILTSFQSGIRSPQLAKIVGISNKSARSISSLISEILFNPDEVMKILLSKKKNTKSKKDFTLLKALG
jgi:transposase-like protein